MSDVPPTPTVLSIAGFDPSGAAGIIVDVATITALNCRPAAAITALTFQNSQEVFGATPETSESLRAQILPILAEYSIAAIKIGLVPTAEIAFEIGELIAEFDLAPPIVDPVIDSSSGFRLMEGDALDVIVKHLLPNTRLLTPNIPEAETLTGLEINDESGMRSAAERLREMGARAVLIKGGHLEFQTEGERAAVDLLDNEGEVTVFRTGWIEARPLRGTGCRLSAAIAAGVAKGLKLEEAIYQAREFVAGALQRNQ